MKLHIIKKRTNSKVSLIEFILNSWEFTIMAAGYRPHGARWPRFYCVQMIETMSWAAAVVTTTTTILQPFSGTTWVSRCQKRTSGLYGARED